MGKNTLRHVAKSELPFISFVQKGAVHETETVGISSDGLPNYEVESVTTIVKYLTLGQCHCLILKLYAVFRKLGKIVYLTRSIQRTQTPPRL